VPRKKPRRVHECWTKRAAWDEHEGEEWDNVISHNMEKGRFNLRSVAVIVHDGSVLIHRAEPDEFWALPGGRVEPFESTQETLRREMKEELDCDVDVERLLWIVENFFEYDGTPYHEIAFYYWVVLKEPASERLLRTSFEGWEDVPKVRLLFQWAPLSGIEGLPLYPAFLRKGLLDLPQHTEHIVHRDQEA